MGRLKDTLAYWRTFVVILTPLVLMPIPIVAKTQAARCGYGILVITVYMVTQCMPMAVAALTPVIIFPLLGVHTSKALCVSYLKDTNILFIGSLIIGIAMEKSGLHNRMILSLLRIFGPRPRWLILGIMLLTWFASIWISNTATTSIMIPLVEALLNQLQTFEDERKERMREKLNGLTPSVEVINVDYMQDINIGSTATLTNNAVETTFTVGAGDENGLNNTELPPKNGVLHEEQFVKEVVLEEEEEDDGSSVRLQALGRALTLAVVYAATIGGLVTPNATSPNLAFKEYIDRLWQQNNRTSPLNFGTWIGYGLPFSVITVILTWLILQVVFFGFRSIISCGGDSDAQGKQEEEEGDFIAIAEAVHEETENQPPFSFAEYVSLFHFVVLVLLWFFRDPGFMPGWKKLFANENVLDSTTTLLIGILIFVWPYRRPNFYCLRASDDDSTGPLKALINWDHVQKKVPWTAVILIGGTFAMMEASRVSGLSTWLGDQMLHLKTLPTGGLLIVVLILVSLLTEIFNNTEVMAIVLPSIARLAFELNLNPLLLMLPIGFAASFSFMHPAGTPPNAIGFSYERVKLHHMIGAGLLTKIVCILLAMLATYAWGMPLFNLNTNPFTVTGSGSTMFFPESSKESLQASSREWIGDKYGFVE